MSRAQAGVQDRNLQRGRRQHGLDVGGHVIGAFGVVAPACIFRRKPVERGGQILEHRRVGIFLDGERCRGVADEKCDHAFDGAGLLHEFRDFGCEVDKAAPRSLDVAVRRRSSWGNRRAGTVRENGLEMLP